MTEEATLECDFYTWDQEEMEKHMEGFWKTEIHTTFFTSYLNYIIVVQGVHCHIYKNYYNTSSLNSPLLLFSFIPHSILKGYGCHKKIILSPRVKKKYY
jgi:hypothetical protein